MFDPTGIVNRWWFGIVLIAGLKLLDVVVVVSILLAKSTFGRPGAEQFTHSWWHAAAELTSRLLMLFIVIAVAKASQSRVMPTLNLRRTRAWVFPVVLVVILATAPWSSALNSALYGEEVIATGSELISAARLGIAATAVLVVPFAEETLFRGFVFNALLRRFSTPTVVIGTALLFALWHFDLRPLWAWLEMLPFGIAAGICVVRVRSVVPLVAAHAIWNLLANSGASPTVWLGKTWPWLATSGAVIVAGTWFLGELQSRGDTHE